MSALDCLELTYHVAWPLNVVVTDSSLRKYNSIFSFALKLRRVVWSLNDVAHRLKRDGAHWCACVNVCGCVDLSGQPPVAAENCQFSEL